MANRRKNKAKRQRLRSSEKRPWRSAVVFLGRRLLSGRAIVLESLSAGAVLLAYWGVYVETQPEVIHGSTLSSPFIIRNHSSIFDMRDVVLTCQLISSTWGGVSVPPGVWVKQTLHAKIDGRIISRQDNVTIRTSDAAHFVCNAEGIQDADINGTPQTLEKLQVGIKIEYRTLGIKRVKFSSAFTWEKMNGGTFEWTEGSEVH